MYILLPLALLSVFYSIHMAGKHRGRIILQKIPGLKTLMIAFVWSAATVFLPILQSGASFDNYHVLLIFAERFALIFAIAIPFDIRDMKADELVGIKTIPLAFGSNRSLKI